MIPTPAPDAKAIAEELAAVLGREQGGILLERARALTLLNANRTGTQTSEFKMAALGVISGFGLLVLGSVNVQPELSAQGMDLVQWSVAGYAVSRGIAKASKSPVS